jgi:protein TonB
MGQTDRQDRPASGVPREGYGEEGFPPEEQDRAMEGGSGRLPEPSPETPPNPNPEPSPAPPTEPAPPRPAPPTEPGDPGIPASAAERSRLVERSDLESFPASDPPSYWARDRDPA